MEHGILANEALQYAIDNEEEAASFYIDLSRRSPSAEMGKFFQQLAGEEQNHKAKLTAIRKSGSLPESGQRVLSLNLDDYQVKSEAGARIDLKAALSLAIDKETASYRLYTDLALQVEETETRQVFEFLAQEESKHKSKLEDDFWKEHLDKEHR